MKTLIVATLTMLAPLLYAEPLLSVNLLTNKAVSVTFASEVGRTYRILTNKSVVGTNWTAITNVLGNGTNLAVTLPMKTSPMFYTIETRTNPLYGSSFFVDSNSPAMNWMNANLSTDPTNALIMAKITTNATSMWLNGSQSDVESAVSNRIVNAESVGQIPIFTLYNIPHRDCGSFSSGGATNASDYISWLGAVIDGMGSTNPAAIVLEPDALANLSCPSLTITQQNERITLITEAIDMLKTQTVASVYVDIGHSAWLTVDDAVGLLKKVNISHADGFSLNVANFQYDTNLIAYGTAISAKLNDIHFVIDSSRNGLGPDTDPKDATPWCNPPGRALGRLPSADTGLPRVDAFLWVKIPGESDGSCETNAPPAGVFWPDYALGLASRAAY